MLKTYRDVVTDGRGDKPLHPDQILRERTIAEFDREDIGYLTQPVRLDEWIATVRTRYTFLANLEADELGWCACNVRDLHAVTSELGVIATTLQR